MIGNSYALQGFYPEEIVARHRFKPINDIPREEMLKRGSFPSVNENKFLTACLNQIRKGVQS
ncbi:DUF2737 family protein [Enterobacter asburiae]|uniref:DUF2737 family protein n=1 Tax=Enterobacter asburiae TaxID=61645 RepID=UPI0034CDBEDC